ncbi:hypothetical protein BX616_005483, partial [Lobosporangium transversale]
MDGKPLIPLSLLATSVFQRDRNPPSSSSSTSTQVPAPASTQPPVSTQATTSATPSEMMPQRGEDSRQKRPRSSQSPDLSRRLRKKSTKEEDSSSAESTSDSESSSSEDSDHEQLQTTNASALKMHGVIHDLMLELERTRTKHAKYSDKVKTSSKKIRDLSRKLERRFRHMSEHTLVASPGSDRTSLTRRPSIPNSNDRVTLASFVRNTVSMTTTKRTQGLPQPPSPSRSAQSHREQTQRPVFSTSDRDRVPKREHSTAGPSLHDDRIRIAASNVVETFTNIHADIRNKAFARKPRNMVMHSSIAGADMEEVMVANSLDGSIQFWDLENRHLISTIPRSHLNQPWCEDMCWVGQNTLAIASAHKEGVPLQHQLALVHVEKAKPYRSALGMSATSISWTIQPLRESPHDGSRGGIVCVSSLIEDMNGMSLVTAGVDKQIVKWQFASQYTDGNRTPIQQSPLHNKHTSTIQALCYASQSNVLYSGGCDCRVIGFDMVRSEIVVEYKNKDGRINSILQNPVDPNLFLISQATTHNQLLLHDTRVRFETPVLEFGFDSADRLSKQILPSWHPAGAIVSSGMQIESKINIWDIRWKDVHRGAGQSIDVHEKRVFKAAFHPKRSLMTSMSSDGSLGFIDFRLNPDTVVH